MAGIYEAFPVCQTLSFVPWDNDCVNSHNESIRVLAHSEMKTEHQEVR